MSTTATPRTWDAEITVYQQHGPVGPGETVAADLPTPRYSHGFLGVPDLLRATEDAALEQAAEYVRQGVGAYADVTIYKTTKARGREADRPGGYACWVDDRVVRVRWGR